LLKQELKHRAALSHQPAANEHDPRNYTLVSAAQYRKHVTISARQQASSPSSSVRKTGTDDNATLSRARASVAGSAWQPASYDTNRVVNGLN
jgi:hypothetical protein